MYVGADRVASRQAEYVEADKPQSHATQTRNAALKLGADAESLHFTVSVF